MWLWMCWCRCKCWWGSFHPFPSNPIPSYPQPSRGSPSCQNLSVCLSLSLLCLFGSAPQLFGSEWLPGPCLCALCAFCIFFAHVVSRVTPQLFDPIGSRAQSLPFCANMTRCCECERGRCGCSTWVGGDPFVLLSSREYQTGHLGKSMLTLAHQSALVSNVHQAVSSSSCSSVCRGVGTLSGHHVHLASMEPTIPGAIHISGAI